MNVTMLLCDAAQAIGGKLYVLGGGWSHILQPNVPVNMALAVKVEVPWDRANEQHRLVARLLTADAEPVEINGQPVVTEGTFEVGRPAGLAPGSPLDAVFALSFTGLALDANLYVWELEIDGEPGARTVFRVGQARRR